MFNQIDNKKGFDKFTEIVGSFSFPYSRKLNPNTTFALVPGFVLLPEKLGNKSINSKGSVVLTLEPLLDGISTIGKNFAYFSYSRCLSNTNNT